MEVQKHEEMFYSLPIVSIYLSPCCKFIWALRDFVELSTRMKKVLIVPMNWGLGHATRCVSIVKEMINAGHEVYISGSGESGTWFKNYFPHVTFIPDCPDYGVFYPKKIHFFQWIWQWPRWERAIVREHRWLQEVHSKFQFDVIISDNRFGIWCSDSTNIFITHQLSPIMPQWASNAYSMLFWKRMKRFQKIWIPDCQGENALSGKLSSTVHHSEKLEWKGWLSRFSDVEEKNHETFDWVAVISGPEMQRTLFEHEVIERMRRSNMKCLVVTGQPTFPRNESIENIKIINHLEDGAMAFVLRRAKKITSRSGYSSLMDYKILNVSAELIPTPGQTEQEYLATRWQELHGHWPIE